MRARSRTPGFSLAAAALAALTAPALAAPRFDSVRKGTFEVRVKLSGTVVLDDVFRVRSIIDGRVERVLASTGTWLRADEPLAVLANKELAALIDAKGSQNQAVLEDRWSRMYQPTPVRCPQTCYLLRSYVKAGAWVKPQAVLLEAAGRLKLVGRVRPEDAPWVRDGQDFTFWAKSDPKRRLQGKIARFILDIQGEKVEPGGTFTLIMGPERFFPPGTEWEGELVALTKPNALMVPTAALLKAGGAYYLPVRVQVGATTADTTELEGGVEERRDVLVVDDPRISTGACVDRHAQELDWAGLKAVCARAAQLAPAAEPAPPGEAPRRAPVDAIAPAPAGPRPVAEPARPAEAPRRAAPAPSTRRHADVLGSEEPEDPYGEP